MEVNIWMDKTVRWNIWKVLVIFDIVVSVWFYFGFCIQHFSIDSFNTLMDDKQQAYVHLTNGRFAATLLVLLIDKLGLNLVTDAAFWTVVFMGCCVLCEYYITKYVSEKSKIESAEKIIIINVGSILIFQNVFIAEWYYFLEALPIYTLAVVSVVFSALCFMKTGWKNQLCSFFLLAAAYNSYQVTLSFYVFFVLFFILQESDFVFVKSIIYKVLKAAGFCVTVFFTNFAVTKYLIAIGKISGSRYSGLSFHNIIVNTKKVIGYQNLIWIKADGMMPGPWMLVMLVLLIVIVFLSVRQQCNASDIVFMFVMLFGGAAVTHIPFLIQQDCWMSPRSVVPLFCIYAVLIFYIAIRCGRNARLICLVCSCIFCCCMAESVSVYRKDIQYSNERDKELVMQIQSEIEEYERKNNLEILYLGFGSDANIQ